MRIVAQPGQRLTYGWGDTVESRSGPEPQYDQVCPVVDRVKMRRFSLEWTKIAIWPSWERLWLVKDDPVIGGWNHKP
ncbi:hypothetical protein F2Q69_00011782 [Brassica cretica]|uniref:Uncharacterized protein n=1 Tax=Brassica cretica TaxID=69181 RepID=A0A8S9QRC8_BRACR|nr:hypothetical protein F2Q69_00011782 [Brassica cretica]